MNPDYITIEEACALSGLSRQGLMRWLTDARVPKDKRLKSKLSRRNGRSLRLIKRTDFDAWNQIPRVKGKRS